MTAGTTVTATVTTTVTTTVPPDIAAWPPLDEDKRAPGQRLLDWAADGEGPRLCLVRGAGGSGKSGLLAWLLAGTIGRPGLTIHATVPSEGLTAESFAWELGRQLGYGALSPDRLLDRVAADERPLLLLVPDLHRAGSGPADLPSAAPETLVAELLEPLLALPHLRAAVEVGTSGLLATHGGVAVVDLGEGDGRGAGRASYAGPVGLCEGGGDGPGGGDGEGEGGGDGRGGGQPTERASHADLVDPGDGDSQPTGQTSHADPVDPGENDGEGAGRASYADLVTAVPRTADDRPDWSRASEAVRRRILDAALRTDGQEAAVRGLLTDPGFLVHGSAAALTATLADERIPVPGRLREVWRRAAPELTAYHADSAERAALLHAAAIGTDPDLAEYLRPLAAQHWWTAVWARPALPVTALALVPGEERQLMASDATGRLRMYDGEGGAGALLSTSPPRPSDETVPPFVHPPAVRPRSVAPRDARSALLLDGSDALIPLVTEDDPTTAFALGRIAEHHGAAALTDEESLVTSLGGGGARTPYAIVGDRGGSVHVWSLGEYQDVPRSHRVHEQPVTAVVCVDTADGLTLAFSAGADGSVRLWETSAEPMPVPVQRRPSRTTALAAADTSVGPVLAVAWSDGELHLWHVLSGRVRALSWLRGCDALTLTPEGLLVIGDTEGLSAVRLRWDGLWEQ